MPLGTTLLPFCDCWIAANKKNIYDITQVYARQCTTQRNILCRVGWLGVHWRCYCIELHYSLMMLSCCLLDVYLSPIISTSWKGKMYKAPFFTCSSFGYSILLFMKSVHVWRHSSNNNNSWKQPHVSLFLAKAHANAYYIHILMHSAFI